MEAFKVAELISKYAKCPKCGNEYIGDWQGGLIVEDDYLYRDCKCGWNIKVDGRGKEIKWYER